MLFNKNTTFFTLILLVFLCACNTGKKISMKNNSDSLAQLETWKDIIIDEQIDLSNRKVKVEGTLILEKNTFIRNGELEGNNAVIIVRDKERQYCEDVRITGTWNTNIWFLNWFVKGNNSINNFEKLTELLHLGKTIVLDKVYPISTKIQRGLIINQPIRIRSENKRGGLLLEINHKKGTFLSSTGDVELNNISLSVNDVNSTINSNNSKFTFIKGVFDKNYLDTKSTISIKDCKINGDVRLEYLLSNTLSNIDLIRGMGFSRVDISDNKIENITSLLTIRSLPYDELKIANNDIRNIDGPVFFFPIKRIVKDDVVLSIELYEARGNVYLDHNHVKNDIILNNPKSNTYISLIIAKGNNFYLSNNKTENIVTKADNRATYAFYCSARGILKVDRHTAINCFNFGRHTKTEILNGKRLHQNALIKLKGTKKCIITNSTFRIEREMLKKVGILDSEKNLSTIDKESFRLALLGITPRASKDSSAFYRIENTKLITPYLNDFTTIRRNTFTFKNNTIKIGYFAAHPADQWSNNRKENSNICFTLFYLRRDDTKNIDFLGNSIEVEEMENGELFIIKSSMPLTKYSDQSLSKLLTDNKVHVGKGIKYSYDFAGTKLSTSR